MSNFNKKLALNINILFISKKYIYNNSNKFELIKTI